MLANVVIIEQLHNKKYGVIPPGVCPRASTCRPRVGTLHDMESETTVEG
jgi:hypothetical protein